MKNYRIYFLKISVLLTLFIITVLFYTLNINKECNTYYTNDRCEKGNEFGEKYGVSDNASFLLWRYRKAILHYEYPKLKPLSYYQYLFELSKLSGKNTYLLQTVLLSAKKKPGFNYSADIIMQNNNYKIVLEMLKYARLEIKNNQHFLNLIIARDAALIGENYHNKNDADKPKLRPWLRYVEATRQFYKRDFNMANKLYISLSNTSSKWVNETSLYMIARIALIQSQANYNGYTTESIDTKILDKSKRLFEQYLQLYPNGLYASSTHNLKRRFMWFRRERKALNKAIIEFFINSYDINDKISIARAVHEVVNRFDYSLIISHKTTLPLRSPILTAILLGNSNKMSKFIANHEDLNRLKQYQKNYSKYPGLYQYVRARLLNSAKFYTLASEIALDDEIGPFQEALKEQKISAYMKLGDYQTGKSLLANLRNKKNITYQAYQYHIKNRQYKLLLTHKTILGNKVTWNNIFIYSSEEDILRIISSDYVTNTQVFLFAYALIKKHYLYKKYKKLANLLNILKQNKRFLTEYQKRNSKKQVARQRFPDIYQVESVINTLAINPKNAKALYKLGYFNQYYSLYNNKQFQPFYGHAPLDYYSKALKLLDKNTKYDFEEKLLYYLIRCFNGTKEKISSCAAQHANSSYSRKARNHWKKWMTRLIRKYPNSKWIKRLPKHMILYAQNSIKKTSKSPN